MEESKKVNLTSNANKGLTCVKKLRVTPKIREGKIPTEHVIKKESTCFFRKRSVTLSRIVTNLRIDSKGKVIYLRLFV